MSYMKVAGMLDIPAHRIKPHTFTYKNIIKLYGEVTVKTVVTYNNHCRGLVDILVGSLNLELLTTREITDAIYGKKYHTAHAYHCIIKNNMVYMEYEFLRFRTYDNLSKVRQLLIDKKNTIEGVLNDN